MGNNDFTKNAKEYLEKLTKQKYISKIEILSLKKMMRKLSEYDGSYKKLFNRITTISNRAKGKNESNILTEFYGEFQLEIKKNDTSDEPSLPEKVWVTEDHNGISKGSCIDVEKQIGNYYYGIHASHEGSYTAVVQKNLCSETSDLRKLLLKVKELNKKEKEK